MNITDIREELNCPSPPGFTPEVRELFDPLRNEVTFLHGLWDTHKGLFGSNESVAALNSTAPGAFSFLGYVLRHELIMTICRITDPKETGKKENLTLDRLTYVIKNQSENLEFVRRLESQLAKVDSVCKPFRVRRNRELGHLDLSTALKTHPEELPRIEQDQIVEVLQLIAAFMNLILGHYTSAHADFVPNVTGPTRNIVYALNEFQRLRKLDFEQRVATIRGTSGE